MTSNEGVNPQGWPVTLLSVFLSLYLLVSTSETQGLLTVQQAVPFDILKKTQGEKAQNSREKLNNSSKKLKVWANFLYCDKKLHFSYICLLYRQSSVFLLKKDVFKTLFFLQKLKEMLIILSKYLIIFSKVKKKTHFLAIPLSHIAEIRSKGQACCVVYSATEHKV